MILKIAICVLIPCTILYLLSLWFPNYFGSNGDKLVVLMSSLNRLKMKERRDGYPTISVKQFKQKTLQGEKKWSVCFGHVIDLKNFSEVHPGGNFLEHFVGRDMSPWMLITHSKSELANKFLSAKAVGVLEPSLKEKSDAFNLTLLSEVDAEYVRMFMDFKDRGEFSVQNAWTYADAFEVYAPLFLGYILVLQTTTDTLSFWLGFFLMVLAASRQGMFYHDIMHRSVFASAKKGARFVYYSSMLLWGFDFNVTGYIHDIHHGFVNIIGLDTAIDMPLLAVDKKHIAIGKQAIPPLLREAFYAANAFFYCFLAWMVLPYYTFYNIAISNWRKRTIAIIRILMIIYFWQYNQYLVFAAVLGFFYFALIGSLNHFHKEMTTPELFFNNNLNEKEKGNLCSFVALQSQTVQNTDHGVIADALLGHFTLHVEHHLFPLMPRRNYENVSNEIQLFLKKHGLGYSVCSQYQAISSFNHTLRYPTADKQTA